MMGMGFEGQVVVWAAYALVGVATFLVANMLFKEEESRAAQDSLEELGDRKASDFLVKITRPFFSQYVVPLIRGKSLWDKKRKTYRRKLISSGLKDELTPDEFIAYKFFLILFFPLVSAGLTALELLDLTWPYILGSGGLGWFYPDFWVSRRIEARHKEIRKSMPFIVDLLALSTEAGLDFMGAMGKVVEKANPSPLVDEFEQLLKEIKVGSSRQDALREMAARINMTEINSFVAILISADQMGAPIGKTLRQQSDQVRGERFLRAEKAGALATQKLMIPTMVFIVPAVILMMFGPFILSVIYSGSELF